MLTYSPLDLAGGPAMFGACAGLLLGLVQRRSVRIALVLPALLIPLMLLELTPPWRIIAGDIRSLLITNGSRPALLVPAALDAAYTATSETFRAAWTGDPGALNWAVSHLGAVVGYVAAAILGTGLRRGARPIAWSFPLLSAVVATGITVRSGSFHILLGVFLVLMVSLVGGFVSRERDWERQNVGFSDLLRWDVTVFGTALLAGAILLGVLVPSRPRNFITTWLWTDVRLPAGLAKLDKSEAAPYDGLGPGPVRQGGTRPGENLELGRSLELGERSNVALTIRVRGAVADPQPYWRGRIFDSYIGSGWTTGPIRNLPVDPAIATPTASEWVAQDVTDSRFGRQLRYGLPDIVAVNQPATMELSSFGSAASWTGSENQYTVYSRAPVPLDFDGPQAVESQRQLNGYREIPPNLPQRVITLAREVTRDAGTQTDRAKAIEGYLRGLKYSYQVEPLRPGGDAVDQFLFTMRAGYCTYYASAMALMARVVGIPSRVAVGYATGTFDPGTGAFVVRESEAHAWPELYIDGQGWTRWEPTPIRPIPARSTRPEQAPPPLPAPAPAPAPARSGWWPVLGIVGVFVLLLIVGRLRRLARPLSAAGVHTDLYRYGRRIGIMPGAGDSVEEYASRLARAAPMARQPIERVARLLTARLYRHDPLTATEERNLVSAWYTVRSLLQRRRDKRA
jgi:hypothetical protein